MLRGYDCDREKTAVTAEDNGLLALANLQIAILSLRASYEKDELPIDLYDDWSSGAAEDLRDLDLYLTGKTENRRQEDDVQRIIDLAIKGEPYHVHLSDGGYSRLTLRPEVGPPVSLDRSLSLPAVILRWDAIR